MVRSRALEIEHLVSLFSSRLEAARFVVIENRLDDRFRLLDDTYQVKVGRIDHAFADESLPHPIDESAPEFAAYQDDWNSAALARLHQRKALGQLVDGAEATWKNNVRRRKAHEHHLAREEIAEVDPDVLECVAALLVRQQDVESDRRRASGVGAEIGRAS